MWLVMAVLLAGMAPAIAAGGTIYVDADASPGGDGIFGSQEVMSTQADGEFPIATTTGNEFGLMAAFDGTNYLVGIRGDEVAGYNITAQMISQTGSLVGPRISIGRTGGLPSVAFDGTNYLMVWEDDATYPNDDIYGQFIDTSGDLAGSPFPISTAAGKQRFEFIGIAFGGTDYLVIWTDGRDSIGDQGPWYVYGQFVSKGGSLIGGEIQISTDPGHFPAIAFDGTNYLVVWVEDTDDTDYYGQFISQSGTLVGQNFVIESNNLASDNPSFILFDGTRYVVNVQDQISADAWGHYVRFVDKEGNVSPTRVTLYEGQTFTGCNAFAFDGTNYLAGLSEGWAGPPVTAKGRYYDTDFNPVGDWFTIFDTQDSKVPIGPVIIFDGTKYFAVTTRAIRTGEEEEFEFSDGDVYGAFIGASDAFIIDISPEDKLGGTSAFDGTNYLVGMGIHRGDNNWDVCAQMVTETGELYGSEIVLSETSQVAMPGHGAFIGFDGTNYLGGWSDYRNGPNSDIYSQFVSKSGILIGSNFAISTATGNQRVGNNVGFDGTNYLIVWTDDRSGDKNVYGQLVSTSGSLVESEIAISTASYNQKDPIVAFDATNYLVVWNDGHRLGAGYGEDIYGQFVTTSGALSGSNFAINENSYPSDNPLGIAFDGTNYLVTWMDNVGGVFSEEWDLFGQLVTTSGDPCGSVVTITTAPGAQFLPCVDFDGTNYLVVWTDFQNDANNNWHYDPGEGTGSDIHGQFLDTSGNLLGSEFAISEAANDQVFGMPCFGDTSYLVAWTDNRTGSHGLYDGFPSGDIYGVFIGVIGGDIIYVDADATGANNGTTWADAYNYLQDALANANSNPDVNEIWVAQGIYKPDANTAVPNGSGDRTATFQLINGVAIKAGYAGDGAPDPNARDVALYETILSGDLNGDDVGFTNNGENSYHVVTGSGTNANAVLDGFTITAGNANSDSSPDYYGGGMYNYSGSPTVTNCTFSGNTAPGSYGCPGRGGGMYNENSSPMVTKCTFSGNSAIYGGGMTNNSASSPTLSNCTISGNSANFGGGGMWNWHSSPTVSNCTFSGNSAVRGGGMSNPAGSSPTVTDCTFSGNSASNDWGGGMYNGSSSPTVTNCIFSANSAKYGGGMKNLNSSPTVTNCTFSGNSASYGGGGMYNYFSSPTLTNCTFSRNSADYGGGMGNVEGSPTITNCILWGNAAPTGHEIALGSTAYPSTLTVRYSDIEGGAAEAYVDPGCILDLDGTNIDADPLFVLGPLHDYYLSDMAACQSVTSPCVDAGSDTAANLGLDSLTTSNAGYADTGTVDIGYHAPPHDWPYITWMSRNGNDITICWNASPSTSYVVEWSTDPEFGTYTNVPVGETDNWTDVGGALQPQRYYRIREQ